MPGTPELKFPTNEAGNFITQEEADQLMIQKLSDETKAMPHVIKKVNGEWQIAGMSVEAYKEMYSENDNSAMYKKR